MTISFSATSFQPSLFNQVEIRTETDEFRWDEQQYQIRLSPRSLKAQRIEKRLHQLYQLDAQTELASEQEEAIVQLHEAWLSSYGASKQLDIETKRYALLQEEANIIERWIASGQLSPDRWITQQNRLFEVESRIQEQAYKISLFTDNQLVKWDDMPTIELMMATLVGMDITQLSHYDNEYKVQLIQQELELEYALALLDHKF